MKTMPEEHDTVQARDRYNRIAWMYDPMESTIEGMVFRRWRKRLWANIPYGNGLEVGVGTGKNMPYYPEGAHLTAIDLSPKMLERARLRASKLKANVELLEMNAEHLGFPDNTFDWAVATFVFCSVPNPVQGLGELSRVVKPDGQIFLLEHVRVDIPPIGTLMDIANSVAVRLSGANINRNTVSNVSASGLQIETLENLGPFGLVKLIIARPG